MTDDQIAQALVVKGIGYYDNNLQCYFYDCNRRGTDEALTATQFIEDGRVVLAMMELVGVHCTWTAHAKGFTVTITPLDIKVINESLGRAIIEAVLEALK